MIESKIEEKRSDSPPALSSLSIKCSQKTLGLELNPNVTTCVTSPVREVSQSQAVSPMTSATSKPSAVRSPQMAAKLATLSKPLKSPALVHPTWLAGTQPFRTRNARHSIDVRTLPSYLAKKRQSTFGQFLAVLNPSAPDASSSSDEPLFEEPIAPTLSLGERVAWVQESGPEFGVVKWIGRMPQITTDWTVGVEFDNCIGSGDGTVEGRRYFLSKENFAKFIPLSSLTKVDNYVGRPRSGTMLSRMSVQLKPGQLISIQRSPSVNIQHCSLNAPHHVGHDVHETNSKHCQCPSCNHPCAHICKTRKPKGRKHEMAHMCHFSSKPHNKMCCGGEDLSCAMKPLTEPGTSWMHTTDMASLRTVPTQPIFRRKSVTIHDDRKAISAPTSIERKPPLSPVPPISLGGTLPSALKERQGSDLSISSLPSSGSPAEVYIARGVLTDESDMDSQTDRSSSPHTSARSKGFRSLVSCFINNSSSLKSKKKLKDKERRKKKLRKQKKRPKSASNMSPFERRRRGLSTDTSYECETTHNSHYQTSSLVSGVSSSRVRANQSPVEHKSTSISPPLTHSPNINDVNSSMDKSNVIPEEVHHHIEDDHISEGNEGQDGCTSSSKSSGHLITTKADIESNINHRSPSSHSTASDCMSPRRRKKGPAPPPPPTTSTSPTSMNLSMSSSSLPQSPTNTSNPSSVCKRRTSYKKTPAPTPPNLTRSMSEQKQLNLKNFINAVPSFRSEVDLQGETRKSSQYDSQESTKLSPEINCSNKDVNEVPLNHNYYQFVSKNDASTQVTLDNDYYEEICYNSNVNSYSNSKDDEKPKLPKKTFDALSLFGCDVSNIKANGVKHSLSMNRSFSMPFHKKPNNQIKSPNAIECDLYSSDLNALLSPKHKLGKAKAERIFRGLSDGSMTSTATVIEFINALTDLENEINLTDAEHHNQSSNKEIDPKVNISSQNYSPNNINVKSSPTKWRYSSSSIDSLCLSTGSRSSKSSEAFLLPNNSKVKSGHNRFERFNNNSVSDETIARNGIHSSASEQSLSSLSSSSTLSNASTIRSSSSTPTPWNQNSYKPHKDVSESSAGKPPKHPIPKPRYKNSYIDTGRTSKSHETSYNEKLITEVNDKNMFPQPGHSAINLAKSDVLWPDQTRVGIIMEQLEVAIAHGQHRRAAVLARELAIRKVTCTLNRSGLPNNSAITSPIIAYLYIEDRVTHRGPIPFQVYPSMSVNMLKLKVEKEFNIPSQIQKWILGKTLATNSNASLATYGITCSGCPIFLYLLNEENDDYIYNENNEIMQPIDDSVNNISSELFLEDNNEVIEQIKPENDAKTYSDNEIRDLQSNSSDILEEVVVQEKPRTYLELVELDDVNCVTNTEPFECSVCFMDIAVGDGVVLRDCLHTFCKFCLLSAIEYNEEVVVKCPFRNDVYSCDSRMQDREVKGVVPIQLYERYLQKSVSTAESNIEKSFHCKTYDCIGWTIFDDNVNIFKCPVCGHENCITCQAIHENVNCKQYQEEIEFQAAQNEDAKKTKEFLDNMLKTGEALRCPQCQVVLMKKWGCDWVKCSMCETEICWVTGQRRWGLKGRGDTSDGCKCMVNGQRCHPKCKYCH